MLIEETNNTHVGERHQKSGQITARRWTRSKSAGLAVLLATIPLGETLVANLASANASVNVAHKSLLKRGLAFYAGKTISFIAPTSTGTPNDLSSRAIATEMGIYLHATINVTDVPAGASVTGQDEIAGSAPNGLTIGFFNLSTDYYNLLTGAPGLNFNPQREVFLGGHPNTLSEIVTSTPAADPSFASLINATAANPLKILEVPSGNTSEAQLLSKIFSLHTIFVPYSSTNNLITGFIRGDSNMIDTDYTNFQSQMSSGAFKDLVNLTSVRVPTAEPGYAVLRTAPNVTQLLKKYPPKTRAQRKDAKYFQVLQSVPLNTLGAPSATKPDLVAALDAAAKFAYHSTLVTQSIVNAASVPGFIPPATEKLAYTNALKSVSAITQALAS